MSGIKITEKGGSRISLPEGDGDKYMIRLMGWEPGVDVVHGSSADYPVSVIKRDFPETFPTGTRMRANHDGLCEDGGDIRRVIAKTLEPPHAEADGMYAPAIISSQWSDYVKEFGDVIGVSISAAGELDPRNDPESEQFQQDFPKTVARFMTAEESPYNSVDFVEAPGADGRIAFALEAARAHLPELNVREQATFARVKASKKKTSTANPPRDTKKENHMDEEERKAFLAEVLSGTKALIAEALTPTEPPKETKFDDVAEAALEAGLSKASREAVYERVRAGATVEDAIAKEKARDDAIRAEVTEKMQKDDTLRTIGGDPIAFGEGASSADFEAELDKIVEGSVK